MDHCLSNELSVICIDKSKSRIAEAFIVRDLLTIPDGFVIKYKSYKNTLSLWMKFL